MKQSFILSKFPRTITRAEWQEIWRWKRQTEKQCRYLEQLYTERIKDKTLPPKIKSELMNRLINPPLVIHNRQQL